jgi:hypothetical protein
LNAFKVIPVAPTHVVAEVGETVTPSGAPIVILIFAVPVQPVKGSKPTIVYPVAALGEQTTADPVVELKFVPGDQVYWPLLPAPVAVNVELPPGQVEKPGLPVTSIGKDEETPILIVAIPVQVPVAPNTV